jgi:hypothetical protein
MASRRGGAQQVDVSPFVIAVFLLSPGLKGLPRFSHLQSISPLVPDFCVVLASVKLTIP